MTAKEMKIYAAWVYQVRREQRVSEKQFAHDWKKVAKRSS